MGRYSLLGDWDFEFAFDDLSSLQDQLIYQQLRDDRILPPPKPQGFILKIKYRGQIVFQCKNYKDLDDPFDPMVWVSLVQDKFPLTALMEAANGKDQNFDDKNEL